MSTVAFEALPLSRANIRGIAHQVRRGLGYEAEPYIDVEKVLDFILPRVLADFSLDVQTQAEMGTAHGLADPANVGMIIREDVLDRACRGVGRDRLTIMHELGHLLLHTPDRIAMRRGVGSPRAFRDPEWQANCFAGELLVSHVMAAKLSGPSDLVREFGVSREAAKYQWQQFLREGLVR